MVDEESLALRLSELGYLRLKKWTYRASWSSPEVEHFLFCYLHSGGVRFTCDFGIRNPDAEQFAVECLRMFAGPLFHDIRFDPRHGCSMRFALGKLAGWSIGWTLTTSAFGGAALGDKVKGDIERLLFPVVRSALSRSDLFTLLIGDVDPCRWSMVSGALRAAMIVYLGRQLGLKTAELESIIQPYLNHIAGSIGRGGTGTLQSPSVFLKKVLGAGTNLDGN